MRIYTLKQTKRTPQIYFNPEFGELRISGRSLPEDSSKFYEDLFVEVDNYIKNPLQTTLIYFNLDYINSISTKVVLQLISKFEILANKNFKVHVIWNYQEEDEIMQETGEAIQLATKIPTEIIVLSPV